MSFPHLHIAGHSAGHSAGAAEAATIALPAIMARLGRAAYGDGRRVKYVRALIRDCGFPPPLPTLVGHDLETGVHPNSLWLAVAVDLWFDNFLPPDVVAALDDRAAEMAAAEMDAAAAGLRLVADNTGPRLRR